MSIHEGFLLVVGSSEIGTGPPDLGAKLTESFFKVLSESDRPPGKIIFVNSGVLLTTAGSPVEAELKTLEAKGVKIRSCTTCLTYFDRMEKLVVGERSNMQDTVSSLMRFERVVAL